MTMSTADLLVTVATHGLTGSLRQWPDAPLTDHQWTGLLGRTEFGRLQGLLLQAVADGALPATPRAAAASAAG